MRNHAAVRLAVTAVSALALSWNTAHAQVIIGPAAATVDAGGTEAAGNINDTFNQSGLSAGYTSGVTNFNAYLASNPLHTATYVGFEWFSGVSSTATVTYDLGALRSIDALALWNEEFSGIGTLNLLGSTNGVTFSAFATGLAPTNNPASTPYPAQVFAFATQSTRYVRFAMSDCPQPAGGGYNGCSIGEVAFRTAAVAAVPEPATLALVGGGLLGLGAIARRRRTV